MLTIKRLLWGHFVRNAEPSTESSSWYSVLSSASTSSSFQFSVSSIVRSSIRWRRNKLVSDRRHRRDGWALRLIRGHFTSRNRFLSVSSVSSGNKTEWLLCFALTNLLSPLIFSWKLNTLNRPSVLCILMTSDSNKRFKKKHLGQTYVCRVAYIGAKSESVIAFSVKWRWHGSTLHKFGLKQSVILGLHSGMYDGIKSKRCWNIAPHVAALHISRVCLFTRAHSRDACHAEH